MALEAGYKNAFWTIVDANVTTLIAAVVLFQFGTGPIKGFAVTLSVGILTTLFTTLVVSKWIQEWVVDSLKVEQISI
jgi:preprotein translocase subunit SecD